MRLILPVAAMVLLGGCLSDGVSTDDAELLAGGADLALTLGAERLDGVGDSHDRFLLAMDATPAGAVAAYTWTIPEGAATIRGDETLISVDLEPVGATQGILEYAVVVFATVDGEARYLAARYDVGYQESRKGVLATTNVDVPAEVNKIYFDLGVEDGTQPGDDLHFILAARADVPAPLGFVMTVDTDDDAPNADSTDRRATSQAAPTHEAATWMVPATGLGSGFRLEHYDDLHGILAGTTDASAGVVVEEDAYVGAGTGARVRVVEVKVEGDEGGWTLAALRGVSPSGAGQWAVDVTAHSVAAVGASTFAQPVTTSARVNNVGMDIGDPNVVDAFVVGGGGGGSSASLWMQHADTLLGGILLKYLHLNNTLDDLLGMPAAAQSCLRGLTPTGHVEECDAPAAWVREPRMA